MMALTCKAMIIDVIVKGMVSADKEGIENGKGENRLN
jgi:hypothetical protein